MYKNIPGFRFYRNAEGGASGGAPAAGAAAPAAPAAGAAPAASGQTMGDAAAASGSSASASVPAGMGAQPDPKLAADFKTSLGEFGKDAMFNDFKDVQGLAKAYADTKKLVGQKLGIPDANATPEVKAAFYKALGVPDDAKDYNFAKPEKLPEGMEYNEEHAQKWAQYFKENNVPASVANALRNKFLEETIAQHEATVTAMKGDSSKTDEGFDKLATKVFGEKKAQAIQATRTMMEKYLSKETNEALKDVPNEHLIALAEFASNFSKEMTGEDVVLSGDGGGVTQSEGEMRQELRRIMALPEYTSPFAKGKEAHEKANQEAKDISTKIAKLQEAAKKRK